jgi:SAM-dependent methyltransferase
MQSFPARLPRAALNAFVSGAVVLAAFLATPVRAAQPSVPYVPTPQVVVDRMLEIAKVGPQDYLIDLGSGDGRIVVTAAQKYGIRGQGVDLNPARIAEANVNARKAGVTDKVQFIQQDLFQTDLTPATVVTMYLLPNVNLELRPRLLQLRPGTRIVSHDFSMGDWEPEQHEELEAKDKYGGSGGRSDIYLWIVPARVAGIWKSEVQVRGKPVPYEFTLGQEFQNASGTARVAGQTVKLDNVKLHARALSFEFTADIDGMPIRHQFSGEVINNTIGGTADLSAARLQARSDWSAVRSAEPASGASVDGAVRAALQ